jgi:hypothetical protein
MDIRYPDIELILDLEKLHEKKPSSCFDYIEAIAFENNEWLVAIFIEPVGALKVKAKTLKDALTFWLILFQSQPEDWDYAKAGNYLDQRITDQQLFFEHPQQAALIWSDGWSGTQPSDISLFI